MMRTNTSDKLREIVAAIERYGSANLTKLTVLKKWFGDSRRLYSFAIYIADQELTPNFGDERGQAAAV